MFATSTNPTKNTNKTRRIIIVLYNTVLCYWHTVSQRIYLYLYIDKYVAYIFYSFKGMFEYIPLLYYYTLFMYIYELFTVWV